MQIDLKTGLLNTATYYETAHANERPDGMPIQLVVVHAISLPPGQFGGTDVIDLFQGKLDIKKHPYYQQLDGVHVSAHLWVQRSGAVCQFVPFHRRAWHAGVSRFATRNNVNDFSIGIELEGTDTAPFTEIQYRVLNQLIVTLRMTYPSLLAAPVVGHSDVAPRRKTDPGLGFEWQKIAT